MDNVMGSEKGDERQNRKEKDETNIRKGKGRNKKKVCVENGLAIVNTHKQAYYVKYDSSCV